MGNDVSGESYALLLGSSAHLLAGNEQAARDTAEKCLALFAQTGDPEGTSTAEIMLDRGDLGGQQDVVSQAPSVQRHVSFGGAFQDFEVDRERIYAKVHQVT